MPPPILLTVVVTALILVVLVVVVGWTVAERRRRAALSQVAADMGLSFDADSSAVPDACAALTLFGQGRGRKGRNMIRGTIEDLEVAIFDFQYTTGHGKQARTHRQTVASIRRPAARGPAFALCPEHFFHKIGAMLGMQDIDLPEHPAFSKRFRLHGPDESAIRAAFRPEVVAIFERLEKLSAETDGRTVIVYRAGRRAKPEEIPALMETAFEVCTALE